MRRNGLFISFEGIDGCGKSTQISLLKNHLLQQKKKVVLTREPGGTPLSEDIRKIILHTEKEKIVPVTELMLYLAARSQHVEMVIRPALMRRCIVLCDRFIDSSVAYQGGGRKLSSKDIIAMNKIATSGLLPDKTFLFDLSSDEAAKRIAKSGRKKDRIEKEGILFQEKVRQAFLEVAHKNSRRITIIDARLSMEMQAEMVFKSLKRILPYVAYHA
jgi:dTMP kinase